MKSQDLLNLSKYLWNVSIEQFAQDIYNTDNIDYYISEKYTSMQQNTLYWLSTLDNKRLNNIANACNKYKG